MAEVKDFPEERLADKVIRKFNLVPPIDVDTLIRKYARLEYHAIPIDGIDGVSLNIKSSSKQPTVIVNSAINPKRQLFTLAHELGHIVIPWHVGTIIPDNIDSAVSWWANYEYSLMEQEANRFAAALLMPFDWVMEKSRNAKLAELHKDVCTNAKVSSHAAALRLTSVLGPGIIFLAEENNKIAICGKSAGTFQVLPEVDSNFDSLVFAKFEDYSSWRVNSKVFHWWKFSDKILIKENEGSETWREILDQIANDIQPLEGVTKFKSSVNAIIAHANGQVKRQQNYSLDSLISACYQVLRRSDLRTLTDHPKFETFLSKKVKDLFP